MIDKILSLLAVICALGFLLWTVRWYAELPTVKFSIGQQKVVAVENFKGGALPLSPLPDKYERVYVK